jgi:hypothetical protein
VISYVLPIRTDTLIADELVQYLRWLSPRVELVVVDGSDPRIFDDFARRCGPGVRHVRPDADLRHCVNGKVAGVMTGIRVSTADKLVIADDDVRYDEEALRRIRDALERADVVRPQNYFDPMPWHAYIDSARTFLNRITGGDWPGTIGVRRSMLERTNGYDGDVLFENLELVRTVVAAGGRELRPLDLYVRRLPPDARHFWSQRVRQAYDEFARPSRLVVWLALAPAAWVAFAWRGWSAIAAATLAGIAAAELGRQIGGGRRVFPVTASLAAPVWLLERAVCAWLALGARVFLGGVPYRGRILSRAANSPRRLRRRFARLNGRISA